jgi:hypothetical protein
MLTICEEYKMLIWGFELNSIGEMKMKVYQDVALQMPLN